jgi:hypothetical protein
MKLFMELFWIWPWWVLLAMLFSCAALGTVRLFYPKFCRAFAPTVGVLAKIIAGLLIGCSCVGMWLLYKLVFRDVLHYIFSKL